MQLVWGSMSVRIVQWVFIVLISKNMIICMLDTPSKDPGQPLDPLDPLAESSYSTHPRFPPHSLSLSQLNPPFRRNKMSNRRKYVDLNSKVVLGENNTDEEVLPFGLPKGLPVDSMAEPGVTLSCVLCHEDKTLPSCCFTAPYPLRSIRASLSFFRL